jgi:hypothetical protein
LDKDKFRQLALKTGSAATERRVYIAARPGASGFLRVFWPAGVGCGAEAAAQG